MIFRQLIDPETSTYTFILADPQTKEGIIIDPVKEQLTRDLQLLKELEIKLKFILETHVHADHITSANDLREATGAKIVLGNTSGAEGADLLVKDGEELKFGQFTVKSLATPGHTAGCFSYYVKGKVFTGDALFIRGAGRTDFQEGSAGTLYESITTKLFTLPDETLVYPAHNYKGMTVSSIGEEKKFNPRLIHGKEKFVEIMNNLNLSEPKKIKVAVPANLRCGKV